MKKLKFLPLLFVVLLAFTTQSMATISSKSEIENDSNDALRTFYKEVKGSKKYFSFYIKKNHNI